MAGRKSCCFKILQCAASFTPMRARAHVTQKKNAMRKQRARAARRRRRDVADCYWPQLGQRWQQHVLERSVPTMKRASGRLAFVGFAICLLPLVAAVTAVTAVAVVAAAASCLLETTLVGRLAAVGRRASCQTWRRGRARAHAYARECRRTTSSRSTRRQRAGAPWDGARECACCFAPCY